MEEKAGEVTTRQLGSATSKEGVPSTSASETGRSRDLLTGTDSRNALVSCEVILKT